MFIEVTEIRYGRVKYKVDVNVLHIREIRTDENTMTYGVIVYTNGDKLTTLETRGVLKTLIRQEMEKDG